MARWEPNALERLRAAALELFEERGYDRTTISGGAAFLPASLTLSNFATPRPRYARVRGRRLRAMLARWVSVVADGLAG